MGDSCSFLYNGHALSNVQYTVYASMLFIWLSVVSPLATILITRPYRCAIFKALRRVRPTALIGGRGDVMFVKPNTVSHVVE